MVTLDADMQNFKLSNLWKLINNLDKEIDMSIGLYAHTNSSSMLNQSFSGLRAIKFKRLTPLINPQDKRHQKLIELFDYEKPSQGYRLEKIIEGLIPRNKKKGILLDAKLRSPGEGQYSIEQIVDGVKTIESDALEKLVFHSM